MAPEVAWARSWENGEVGEREKVRQCCRLACSSPRLQTENPACLIHHRRLITQELQAGDDEFLFGRPQRQLLQKLQRQLLDDKGSARDSQSPVYEDHHLYLAVFRQQCFTLNKREISTPPGLWW
ncbi:hypothetical protein DV515_00007338 [Chloebia gouldiae]|uniref:Uncharacterized protein n=1 Tax=Chloebia gouldiae TaxID=44316 RepID=A0A3L8SHV7_CHLGU|nr:hypothetical protein DV515_00007338 [Chloebia gouldiae]